MIHFMKNLTIMGGMLYVMAFGAGPVSLDNRKSG
jgi:putative oxidoreductase